MDSTIRNISQLEEALSKMKRPSELDVMPGSGTSTPILTPRHTGNNSIKEEDSSSQYSLSQSQQEQYRPISRTSTSQLSTNGLLQNMAGLQTSTNVKLDKLTDAVYSLQNSIERLVHEQVKQTELLATIARNTVSISSISSNSSPQKSNSKTSEISIKEYGFNTNLQLFAEFIMKMIRQIQSQAMSKSRQYKITRDLTQADLRRVVDMAMKNTFRISGSEQDPVENKGLKISAFVKVASRIGSTNGINPIITSQAFREIFDDSECGVFVRSVERIMERLRILKVLLPYYEADIIASLEYPYFGTAGDALCNWSMLSPREETKNEAIAIKLTTKEQNQLAKLLAKGISEKHAISAVVVGV